MRARGAAEVRCVELVAAASLATDLGMGQPPEHALRTCLLALHLGEALCLSEAELGAVHYAALLRRIGCTADAFELGRLFGDDRAAHARLFVLDFGRPLEIAVDVLRHAGAGRAWPERARTVARALAAGPALVDELFRASCEVAQRLAGQLVFEPTVLEALGQTFERWDGRGAPNGLRGEAIALPARIVQVAEDAEVCHRLAGVGGAVALVRSRAGASHDPWLAELFARHADRWFELLAVRSLWDAVLDSEPGPRPRLAGERFDVGLATIGLFADLKSPHTAGHSAGVAELAAAAALRLGLPEVDVKTVRRAALVHDLGRVAVPNCIWDKPGPLTDGEWERVSLHAYYGERVLARSGALAGLAAVAGLHHERLDGSGYHRGAPASMLPPTARLLAAAAAFHAMTESRPHRAALGPARATDELRAEVRAGRFDGAVVEAVLAAAGQRARRRREGPARLSAREVEVLRLLARGHSNRAIARRLAVSEATVAAHVRHIYDKIGASTRAAATLYAAQHGLLDPDEPPET